MSSPARPFRLTASRRIGELFAEGLRASDGRLTLLGLPNGLDRTRVGMAVGRRQHGNAVRRNRVRRLCREAFRRVVDDLPVGWDLVILPRGRSDHTVDRLAASLTLVAGRLEAKAARRAAQADTSAATD